MHRDGALTGSRDGLRYVKDGERSNQARHRVAYTTTTGFFNVPMPLMSMVMTSCS